MPTPLPPAVGQRTWLGVGRQPYYNTASVGTAPPAVWHGVDTFSPVEKFAYIDRPEVRYLADRVLAAAGPYSFSASLKVAPDPGAVEQLIAYAMGMQSCPASIAEYTTHTTAAVTTTGSQSVNITASTGTGNFTVGQSVAIDVWPNQEVVTLTAVGTSSITAVFGKTHLTNVAVVGFSQSTFSSLYSFGPSATSVSFNTTAAITSTGSQAVTVQPYGAGIGSVAGIYIGSTVAVGGANPETVVVTGVSWGYPNPTITANFTQTHLTGVTLTVTTAFIKELPYFMLERYRDTDCYDYFGNAIDTMKISVDMGGKLVGFEFGLVGGIAAPISNASPTSPSFSTLQPYTSEITAVTYSGNSGSQVMDAYGNVPAQSVTINLNNQLDKNYRVLGSQFPWGFPLGSRKVNGTLKTGFENNSEFLDFLNQGTFSLTVRMVSASTLTTYAPNGTTFGPALTFVLPNCRILQDPVSHKNSGPLDQTVTFEAYASGIGTNDSLTVTAVNQAAAVY